MKALLIFLISTGVTAAVIEECGEYRLKGSVLFDEKKHEVYFAVLKNTRSEAVFNITSPDEISKVAGLKDNRLAINAVIRKKMDGMKGEIDSISNVRSIMPDETQSHSNIELLKSQKCN